MALELNSQGDAVRLGLKVVPGASRDRIVGELGNVLKVAVSKPPEGGAANRAVIELLADALKIAARQIQLVQGQSSPRKVVLISGLSAEEIRIRLARLTG